MRSDQYMAPATPSMEASGYISNTVKWLLNQGLQAVHEGGGHQRYQWEMSGRAER